MNEHLQRALVEVYYAIAEFNQGYATMPVEQRVDACAQLIFIKATLEKLLLPDHADLKRAA